MFRLCIRDEFGLRTLAKPKVILKSTALRREIKLRTEKRKIQWAYHVFKVPTWDAFRENIDTIRRLTRILNSTLTRYGKRRLQAGLFYLPIDRNRFEFKVRSHLYDGNEFLKDLWRKKRLEHKMRQTNQEAACNSSERCDGNLSAIVVGTLKLCSMKHLLCLLLVIFLAFMIVYL